MEQSKKTRGTSLLVLAMSFTILSMAGGLWNSSALPLRDLNIWVIVGSLVLINVVHFKQL